MNELDQKFKKLHDGIDMGLLEWGAFISVSAAKRKKGSAETQKLWT